MLSRWLQALQNWVGDSSLELAIRREIRAQRLPSHRSQIRNCRLVAIQRPGWVQVYQFEVETRDPSGESLRLFGIVRDDGRTRSVVRLFVDEEARDEQREEWSEGLLVAGKRRR